jgi:hypothetical protein
MHVKDPRPCLWGRETDNRRILSRTRGRVAIWVGDRQPERHSTKQGMNRPRSGWRPVRGSGGAAKREEKDRDYDGGQGRASKMHGRVEAVEMGNGLCVSKGDEW